jgi:uncharacterized membrane protein
VDDAFLEELGEKLEPGMAAVIVLVHRSTPDKVIPAVREAEARLREALQVQRAAV